MPRRALVDAGVGQADDLAQGGGILAGGDVAADVRAVKHQMAFQRLQAAFGQAETHQCAFQWLGFEDVYRAAADEERLGATDRPAHVDFRRVSHSIGVLTDDHVAFFHAQQALGFDAKGTDVVYFASLNQRIPKLESMTCRYVDFITQLADKTDSLHCNNGASDEFTLAAAVQNRRRLAKLASQGPPSTG